MKPADIGLPASRFPEWYPGQQEAVIFGAVSATRFTMLNMPTGTGKSAVGAGIGSIFGGRTAILTSTRSLQYQYEDYLREMGLIKLMGQNNYPCLYFADDGRPSARLPGCDEGPCHAGIHCDYRDGGCHYYDAVRRSLRHPAVAFNYKYWMSSNRYAEPGSLGRFDTLVLDEAHDAADQLADFVRVHLEFSEVRNLIEMDVPRGATVAEWVEWAEHDALPVCRARLEASKTNVSLYRHGISVLRRLRDLEVRLTDLAGARHWRRTGSTPDPDVWVPGLESDWITEETKTSATFSPVWAGAYAEDYLFSHIPRIVLMSATVTPRDAVYLGVRPEEVSYKAFPSPFSRKIRPVLVIPGASVGRNMSVGEERMWINRMDSIIEFEGRSKGIIHAVSYARAKAIAARSRYGHLMVIHDREGARRAVERFKKMEPPAILVSPAVETGVDFPYDLARYQIIAKIPFVDARPLLIQARKKADPRYLDHVAMVRLIQMAGRGVRAPDDYCRCWIVDDNWSRWFYPRNKDLVPKWFKMAIRKVRSVEEAAA